VAISFVDWDDIPRWQLINKELGLAFHDPIETYSSSEHVYTGLGIPTDATGKLPSAQRTRAGLGAEKLEDLGETGRKPKQSAPQRSKPSTSPRSPSKSAAPAPAREKSDRPQRSRNRTRGGKPAQG
jgi:hypothetical protein